MYGTNPRIAARRPKLTGKGTPRNHNPRAVNPSTHHGRDSADNPPAEGLADGADEVMSPIAIVRWHKTHESIDVGFWFDCYIQADKENHEDPSQSSEQGRNIAACLSDDGDDIRREATTLTRVVQDQTAPFMLLEVGLHLLNRFGELLQNSIDLGSNVFA
jgi:hypothetical protein